MKLFAIKIGGALVGVIQSGDNTGPRTLEHAAQLEPLDSTAQRAQP